MDIRPATQTDLPTLAATLGQREYFAERLARQAQDRGVLLVAWDGDTPIGDVYLWCEPTEEPELRDHLPGVPMMNHLEVSPPRRNGGVGTTIIRETERVALQRGYATLALAVELDNRGARRLYERLGYSSWGHGNVLVSWQEPTGSGGAVTVTVPCDVLSRRLDEDVPGVDDWDAWRPEQAAEVLGGCPVPWAVAGGWALDLYLGAQTREHSDLEIAVPHDDFPLWRSHLSGYELYAAGNGRLWRLAPREQPQEPVSHQVWAYDRPAGVWRLDTFLEPGDRRTWVSHRDARVSLPLADAVRHTDDGLPYLCPQAVLFTKAKARRDKDEDDFTRVAPLLDGAARRWLAATIGIVYPDHPWLARL